jgi:hypothetical protein
MSKSFFLYEIIYDFSFSCGLWTSNSDDFHEVSGKIKILSAFLYKFCIYKQIENNGVKMCPF